MKPNEVFSLSDKCFLGPLVGQPNLEIAEVISTTSVAWVFIDEEHSALSIREIQDVVRVYQSRDVLAAVRVFSTDSDHLKRICETGCDAIILPMIESADELEKCVLTLRYPPVGQRSVGPGRVSSYGYKLADVLNENSQPFIIAQIESKKAVEAVNSISSVPGLGALFIGPFDLSGTLGVTGEIDNPLVVEHILSVVKTANERKIPLGIYFASREKLEDFCMTHNTAFNFAAISSDMNFIRHGCEALL